MPEDPLPRDPALREVIIVMRYYLVAPHIDLNKAIREGEAALAGRPPHDEDTALIAIILAGAYTRKNRTTDALRLLAQVIVLELPTPNARIRALCQKAITHHECGEQTEGLGALSEACALTRQYGDRILAVLCIGTSSDLGLLEPPSDPYGSDGEPRP